VCACWGAGFRPRPRHAAVASAPVGRATRPPAHSPVQGGGSSEIATRCRTLPTGWQQAVDKNPSPAAMKLCFMVTVEGQGSSPARRPAAGSAMEGTSGAADPGPLRGGASDAALGGIAERATPNGVAPDRAGVSSRWGSGSMTRGVRADRVGKKLSSGRPQGRRPKRGGPRREGRSWPVKTRLVSVRAGSAQAARPAGGRRDVATRAR